MTLLLILKTIHMVGFVAWFAGLFYLVRMFVYHNEAYSLREPDATILKDRYALMESRVYQIICNPAMMITWTAGLIMLYFYGWDWFRSNIWMHQKILLLILLTAYHLYSKKMMKQLTIKPSSFSTFSLRLYNEVPALLLVGIVILAVFKNITHSLYVFLVILGLGILFFIFAKIYARSRLKNE